MLKGFDFCVFFLHISMENTFVLPFQNSLYLNNKAKIVSSDAVGTNGVIHVIDKILVPQHIQQFPTGESGIKRVRLVHIHIISSDIILPF